jgi:tetratricopeptide (TPR) repeat protein
VKTVTRPRLRVDRIALGIFALALVARLLHVLAIRHSPFYDQLLVDSVDFDARAAAILRGSWPEPGALYQAPLYPLFLSLIYKLFGHSLLAVRLIQSALGAGSAVLTYAIGKRCCGRAAGVAAGSTYALYAMSIHFDSEILRPSLVVFLSLWSLYLLLDAERRRAYVAWAASGFVLGLACVARPTVLAFLPAAALWILFKGGRGVERGAGRGGGDRSGARGRGSWAAVGAALVMTLGALVPVGTVTAVNYARSGQFVPISYNGGINFYIGTNGRYDETVGIRPGIRWDLLTAEPPADRFKDPVGWSGYYYGKAELYIHGHTKDYLRLLFKKFVLFWNGHEIERNTSFVHLAEYSPILAHRLVSFRWVAPLALAGIALAAGGRVAMGLPGLLLLSQMAATIAFFVVARYRMIVVPVLCLFAGYAVVTLVSMVRRRALGARFFAAIAIAALAGFAINADWYGISKVKYSRPDYERAMILRREGRTDEAVEYFKRAVDEDPGDPDPLFQWGVLLAGRGAYDGAARLFEEAASAEPRYARSWFNLGLCLSRSGKAETAVGAYERALDVDPSYWEAAVGLGDALVEEKCYGEASDAYRRSLGLARNRREGAVSSMSLGRAEALQGDYESSLESFDRALADSPGSIDARLAKARILLLLDRRDEAEREVLAAARIDSTDVRVKAILKKLGLE